MRVFSLAVYEEYTLTVELFSTEEAAQNAFMRDLYESYQDCDLPDKYDEIEISDFICSIGESLIWTITEHDSYVDSGNRISL